MSPDRDAATTGGDPATDTAFDPVAFLERAVPIASHESVEAMRDVLVETLTAHGVAATVDAAGNTVATRGPGTDGVERDDDGHAVLAPRGADTHVVLNTHIDTVPPHVPFERDGDVLRGRGSCDAKGPLAALLAGFLAVDPDEGRVTLAVTPDEETLSTGAAALSVDADACIVGEPTGLDVCNAAKGRFQGTVTLTGESAHAAEPDSGTSAALALPAVFEALSTFDDRPDAPPVHPDLGAPTLTPTVVEAGQATNQVPAEATVVVDRRSVPPETAEGFREALTTHLRAAVPADVGVEFALTDRETPFLEAFETPAEDPLVTTLAAAAGDGDGGGGAVRPFTAATEASYFAADAPTVVFGPGYLADDEGPVAHADREYVPVPQVRAAADAVTATLERFV